MACTSCPRWMLGQASCTLITEAGYLETVGVYTTQATPPACSWRHKGAGVGGALSLYTLAARASAGDAL